MLNKLETLLVKKDFSDEVITKMLTCYCSNLLKNNKINFNPKKKSEGEGVGVGGGGA